LKKKKKNFKKLFVIFPIFKVLKLKGKGGFFHIGFWGIP